MKLLSTLFYSVSAVFMSMGFHKLYVYENTESFILESKNAYVGGDAYNYIINMGFATSLFIVAAIFTILGSVVIVIDRLSQEKIQTITTQNESLEVQSS